MTRFIALLPLALLVSACEQTSTAPIRVGVLHSQTGTMAISEVPVAEATLMAIAEINADGGLLGRPIEPVVVDGASDEERFGLVAEQLIVDDGVDVIFGGWTSASRKEIKPVVEAHDHLLLYPVQYEGMESSDNIVYLGATPNQQLLPALKWFFDNRGTRFFLVGSDYIYPHSTHATASDYLTYLGGTIVGESYVALGGTAVEPIVAAIQDSGAQVIVNTINGDTNLAFFGALRAAGITSADIPTLSLSLSEAELASMDVEHVYGDYAAWNYFQSEAHHTNLSFVERFQGTHGAERTLSDPMAAAYSGVYLWAQAVIDAGTSTPGNVLAHIGNQHFEGPQGDLYVDAGNLHTWKSAKIGRIRRDGQFDLVWQSEAIIHPVPYPPSRSHNQWHEFLQRHFRGWGERWNNIDGAVMEDVH